jgi:hypothetical protein
VKLRFIDETEINGRAYLVGSVDSFTDEIARSLIKQNKAVPYQLPRGTPYDNIPGIETRCH